MQILLTAARMSLRRAASVVLCRQNSSMAARWARFASVIWGPVAPAAWTGFTGGTGGGAKAAFPMLCCMQVAGGTVSARWPSWPSPRAECGHGIGVQLDLDAVNGVTCWFMVWFMESKEDGMGEC